jgi:divalent metal cation (Fe/Co/Zn/Cd) transporter
VVTSLYRRAQHLAVFTILYNIVEGVVSTAMGYSDETLALFGFGVDSFIESISGVGVYVMIRRIADSAERLSTSEQTEFEKQALRITGWSFYGLSLMLAVTVLINLVEHKAPESTFWGVVISAVSIVVMSALVLAKRTVGRELKSAPILADANCTLVCIYMSIAVLISSAVYELTAFAYADAIGALAIIWFSVSEGRECFAKAKGHQCGCEHE